MFKCILIKCTVSLSLFFRFFFLQYFIILEIYPLGYVFEKHFLISIVVGFIVLVRCYKSHSSK